MKTVYRFPKPLRVLILLLTTLVESRVMLTVRFPDKSIPHHSWGADDSLLMPPALYGVLLANVSSDSKDDCVSNTFCGCGCE